MPLARMHHVITFCPCRIEHILNRADGRAREFQIITHLIDVSSFPAKVGLHVDYQHDCILRTQIAVKGPGIGIGFDAACHVASGIRSE